MRTNSLSGKSFFWLSKHLVPPCCLVNRSNSSMTGWADSNSQLYSWGREEASPIYQWGCCHGKFQRRVRNPGRRPMYRPKPFPGTPPHTRVSVCLQQPPPPRQVQNTHHPDSSLLLCLEDSRKVRSCSLASSRDFECGCTRDLMSLLMFQVLPGKLFVSRQQAQ